MCFNQSSGSLKLVDKFTYLESSVTPSENDINTRLTNAWIAIDRLSVIWKLDLSNKINCSFFQAAIVSVLLNGCTTWTLTKHMEKKLESNCTRMLRAVLNKSWRHHPTKQQLYGHLPPISKTIQIRQTRHADTPGELRTNSQVMYPRRPLSHGRTNFGRPTRIYLQQLCTDTGYCLEYLPGVMDYRDKWRERVREICASGRWWCWWCMYACHNIPTPKNIYLRVPDVRISTSKKNTPTKHTQLMQTTLYI